MVGKWVYWCNSPSTMAEWEGWQFEAQIGDKKYSVSFSDANADTMLGRVNHSQVLVVW